MSVTSGWGRLTYGQANWNQATTLKTGWGAQAWNGGGAWGQTSNQVVSLTGQSISSSIGSPTVVDMTVGLSGQSVTSSQGTAFNPVVVSGISASFSVASLAHCLQQLIHLCCRRSVLIPPRLSSTHRASW